MVVESQGTETVETPESAETPAATEGAETSASSETADGSEAGQGGAVVPPPYQPNLTYRVRDPGSNRQVEKKIEDWLLPVIKDPDVEKKVRELHERAYGLDAVKQDRERLSGEYGQLKQVVAQKYQPMEEAVQQIIHARDQKNLPALFDLVGIPPQEVFKWAVQYGQMSPEARQLAEHNSRVSMEAFGAQRQMTQAEQQQLQMQAEFKSQQMDMLLRYDTQVSSAASDFDQQHGNGAFLEQVRRTGDYYWRMGQDITVEQAVQEVLRLTGRGQTPQPQAYSQQPQPQVPGQGQGQRPQMQTAPQAPASKPVIPSIQGTGTSPVKRVYSSMEDIRKRKRELEDAEA